LVKVDYYGFETLVFFPPSYGFLVALVVDWSFISIFSTGLGSVLTLFYNSGDLVAGSGTVDLLLLLLLLFDLL